MKTMSQGITEVTTSMQGITLRKFEARIKMSCKREKLREGTDAAGGQQY